MTRRRPARPPKWPILVRVVRELPEHGCAVAIGPVVSPWPGPLYDEERERARLARGAARLALVAEREVQTP